jgi:hypothetical protein
MAWTSLSLLEPGGLALAGTNAHGADCLADTCVTVGVFVCLAIF